MGVTILLDSITRISIEIIGMKKKEGGAFSESKTMK